MAIEEENESGRRDNIKLATEISDFINSQESNFSLASLSKELKINSKTAKMWMTIFEIAQHKSHTVKSNEVDNFVFWEKITPGFSPYEVYQKEFRNNNRNLFG